MNECDVTKAVQILKDSLVYRSCKTITPSDTDDLEYEGKPIAVTTAGTIKVLTSFGDIATFTVALNEVIPVIVRRVFNTGTSAAGICILR